MSDLQQFINNQVPEGWTTKPFWSMFRRVKYTNFPDEELLSVYRDYGVIPKSSRDDNHNKASEDLSNYQLIDKGWLVTNKMKAWQGSIAISRHRGIVSPAYYAYKPLSKEHDQFLHYLLRSDPYIALYKRISKGVRVNQWDLEHEALRTVPILLPSYDVQKDIANFLDQETARIDQLLEKKKLLIQTLKIQSNSIVTEGILQGHRDYNIQRHTEKNSRPDNLWPTGIKPQLFPLKLLCLPTKSLPDKTDPDMNISYIDIGNVSFSEGVKSIARYRFEDAPSRARQIIYQNDLIVSTVRTYLKAGAFIEDQHEENLICSTGFCVLRANDKIYPKYLYRAVQSEPFISGVVVRSEGVSYPAVNSSRLLDLKIPLPSKGKQKVILDRIDRELSPIFEMINKTKKSIDMIVEYKTSLITEAVTGQLDIEAWKNRSTVDRRLDEIQKEMAS